MVDGNNLHALTAATHLEEKPCVITGKEPPPRTHVTSDDVLRISVGRENGSSGVHVVVAKDSDVTERMIHTGEEQTKWNETRNFRDRGAENRRKERGGGGGQAGQHKLSRLRLGFQYPRIYPQLKPQAQNLTYTEGLQCCWSSFLLLQTGIAEMMVAERTRKDTRLSLIITKELLSGEWTSEWNTKLKVC